LFKLHFITPFISLLSYNQRFRRISLRSDNMQDSKQRRIKASLFWVFSILLVAYLGSYKLITKGEHKLSLYHDAQIHYGASVGIDPTKFERLDDPARARIGFAERKGQAFSTRLHIGRSANLVVIARPGYQSSACDESGTNRAHLRISSPHVLYNQVMLEGQVNEVRFPVYKGDRLNVTIDNPVQRGCGGAFLTFYEKNKVSHYSAFFFVAWALFGIALIYLSLPLHVAVLGAGLNLLLLFVHKQLGFSGFADLSSTSYLSAIFCAAWLLIFSVFTNKLIRSLLTFVLLLVALALPVIFIGHVAAFDALPTVETFHAMLQSHKNQIIEFWLKILGVEYILATATVIIAVLFGLSHLAKTKVKRAPALFITLCLCLFGAANPWKFVDASPMIRMATSAVSSYFHELSAFQELEKQRTSNPDSIIAQSTQQDTSLVVIIGESANKHHMSAYGYPRKTTPYADQLIANGEMLRFDSAYSNHTYSNPTVSRALTAASNYNGKPWVGEPSALAVANAADISTTWISNKLKFGPWDNVMSVIGDDAQETIHINSKIGKNLVSNRFDGALVPLLAQALKSKQSHKLIFIHLQGSHVDYAARYPKSHSIFTSTLDSKIYGSAGRKASPYASIINTYDNSIFYTDSVMKDVVELLKAQDNKVAMLYFSDHGENVFGRKSHNAAQFEYDMAEIPLMFWANPAWQAGYQSKWQNLKTNLGQIFTNDHVFDSVLGLSDIDTDYALASNDLSSGKYIAEPSPTTLHGNKPLDTERNGSFWLSSNLSEFSKAETPKSAATASSIGHVTQIASSGVNSVSLSIALKHNDEAPKLIVRGPSNTELAELNTVVDLLEYHNAGETILSISKFDPLRSSDVKALIEKFTSGSALVPTVLFDPQNIQTMQELSGVTATGLDLRSSSAASIQNALSAAKLGNEAKALFVLSEQGYQAVQAEQRQHFNLIVDASKSLSLHNKTTKSELSGKAYWVDQRVQTVIVSYQSMFAN